MGSGPISGGTFTTFFPEALVGSCKASGYKSAPRFSNKKLSCSNCCFMFLFRSKVTLTSPAQDGESVYDSDRRLGPVRGHHW